MLIVCVLPCQAEEAKSGWTQSERELDEALTKGLLASKGLKQCQDEAAAAAAADNRNGKETKRPRPSKHGGTVDGKEIDEEFSSSGDAKLERKLDELMAKLAVRPNRYNSCSDRMDH
eukprot:COSAG02_NODE_6395_length_3600_cov_4.516710_2_plen_117_part_00